MIRLTVTLVAVVLLWTTGASASVGFQWATAPDPDRDPLKVAIWYPATATPGEMAGPFEMKVATDAPISGSKHPLIVMSHGTGGMALNSYDTAIAMAKAGFVVAAVTHTGDNYLDRSVSFSEQNFSGRPRQISRVIDFMLMGWSGHGTIDPSRIGMFGHSAGGTTALIDAGGVGDWRRALAFCQATPDDWGCRNARDHATAAATTDDPVIKAHDPRIKAIVVAAPAITHIFKPDGLSGVQVPVQLWVGTRDEIVVDAAGVRSLLPRKPDYHLVPNAGHFAYLSRCSDILQKSAPEICADPNGFDRAKFLRMFQVSVIAFYKAHLG